MCDLYDTGQVKQSGSTCPIKVAVCDVNNQNVGTPGTVPHAGGSNGGGTFRNTDSSFMSNLKTTGIGSGNYKMFFTLSGIQPCTSRRLLCDSRSTND